MKRRISAAQWLLSISIAGGAGLVVASSFAEPAPGMTLEWVAPDGCATGQEVEARIARLLAGSSKASRDLVIHARVEHARGVWRGTLETVQDGRRGKREIDAESCDALADAAALIVAMSVDPQAVLQNQSAAAAASVAPPASPTAAPPASAPPPARHAPPRHEPARSVVSAPHRQHPEVRTRRYALGVAVAVDAGRLPAAALGEEVQLAWAAGPVRLELGGSLFLPQTYYIAAHPGSGGRFRLVAGRLRGCYRYGERALIVAACGGADLSWITAQGLGVRTSARGDEWLISPALGGEMVWPAQESVALFLSIDVSAPLGRRPFVIDGVAIHEPSRLTGAAALGGEVHF